MSDERCGATYRGIGSDFHYCAKAPHDVGLHVALLEQDPPDGSDIWPYQHTIWWFVVSGVPWKATPEEVRAELASLSREAVTDENQAPAPVTPDQTAGRQVREAALVQAVIVPVVEDTEAAKRWRTKENRRVSIESGYTGDACGECGAMKLTRNGSCMKCHGCGATTGCS